MKILYVARHGQRQSNDDEGAIAHAFRGLGHEVVLAPETARPGLDPAWTTDADFCLIHKWADIEALAAVSKIMPVVMWYFDLVEYPDDPSLNNRSAQRRNWMEAVLPYCLLAVASDGDWVEKNRPRMRWLTQGADERFVGMAQPGNCLRDILFTGSVKNCGRGRQEFIDLLHSKYGSRVTWVSHSCHQHDLAALIASHKVFVCPPTPTTDNYWSNRVYLGAGFGAPMVHPYCERLAGHFDPETEVVYYADPNHMLQQIDRVLDDHLLRARLRANVLRKARERHLYRHRCAKLIQAVRERV